MSVSIQSTAWREIDAGLRTSTGLKIGAFLLALCTVARLGFELAAGRGVAVPPPSAMVPWWLFILALSVLGVAYLSLTWRPMLGSSGWFPGTAHLLQASYLVLVLYLVPTWASFSTYLPLLKYTGLAVFASRERRFLHPMTRVLLLAFSLAEIVKLLVRNFLGLPVGAALVADLVLLATQVIAVWRLADDIAYHEDFWASCRVAERAANMEEFAELPPRSP